MRFKRLTSIVVLTLHLLSLFQPLVLILPTTQALAAESNDSASESAEPILPSPSPSPSQDPYQELLTELVISPPATASASPSATPNPSATPSASPEPSPTASSSSASPSPSPLASASPTAIDPDSTPTPASPPNPLSTATEPLAAPESGDISKSSNLSPLTLITNPLDITLAQPFTGDYPISYPFGAKAPHDLPLIGVMQSLFGVVAHNGIDWAMPIGTPILAADSGQVIFSGRGDYGLTVILQHSWGKSYYGHLSQISVTIGDKLTRGDEIGLSGNTGFTTGPHLHFGIIPLDPDLSNGYRGFIDPLPFLNFSSLEFPQFNHLHKTKKFTLSQSDFAGNNYQITLQFLQTQAIKPHVTLTNPHGQKVTVTDFFFTPTGPYTQKITGNLEQVLTSPGLYTLAVADASGNYDEQDFTWGVLAANTDKFNYQIGEIAKIHMAVLDNVGEMICDAAINLKITHQESGSVAILSSSTGSVRVNQEACTTKKLTLEPDYEARYTAELAGHYQIEMTVITNAGIRQFTTSFTVNEEPNLLHLSRTSATRLYPLNVYPMILTISPNLDFHGTFTEQIPAGIAVTPASLIDLVPYLPQTSEPISGSTNNFKLEQKGNVQTISWDVDWSAGETYTLGYFYDVPDESPAYYHLGPLTIGDIVYSHIWALAIDASGSGTNSVDPTSVNASSTDQTFTFTYDPAETFTYGGELNIKVPTSSAWSTPQGNSGTAGYTTASISGTGLIADTLVSGDSTTEGNWTLTEDDTDACNTANPAVDTTVKVEGSGAIKCGNSSSAATDATDSFSFDNSGTVDWSGYTTIGFWLRSSKALTATNGIAFAYDDTADMSSLLESFNTGTVSANTWTYFTFTLTATRTAVKAFGLVAVGSGFDSADQWLDDVTIGPGSPSFPVNGSDTDIRVRFLSLDTAATVTVTYGSGGGTSGVDVPATPGNYEFTSRSRVATSSTWDSSVNLGSHPTVTVDNPTISIGGTANGNDGATVRVAVNGTLQGQTDTIGSSTWEITGVTAPSSGDIITVWVDNVADSNESTAVTKYSSGNISGMVLDTNVLTLGSNQDQSLTVTNLDSYDCTSDEDIMHQAGSSHLKVEGDSCAGSTTNSYSAEEIEILSGDTLTVGTTETLTTYDLTITGTLTSSGNSTYNVAHDWNRSGTFTQDTSTVNLTGAGGTTQTITGTNTFYTLSATGSSARTIKFPSSVTTTISNSLTLTGAASQLLTLDPGTATTTWTISAPATTSVSYVSVSYSTNSGTLFCATYSTDGGNNSGWNITATDTCPIVADSGNSFQRKTWHDGTRYWRSYLNTANNRIEFEYSTDGASWTENTSARIAVDTTDYSVEADSSNAFIVYTSANDIKGRVASSYPGTGFTWGTEQVVLDGTGATDDYDYPSIERDSSSYIWVTARYTGSSIYHMHAIKETGATNDLPEDSADTVYELSDNTNTNSNVYGALTALTSQNMYLTFALGTTLAGCKWVNSAGEWQDSSGSSCEAGAGGSITRVTESNTSHTPGTNSFSSNSFTPANNSLLVVYVNGGIGATTVWNPTISDSETLTWTERAETTNEIGGWTYGGTLWTAPVSTGTSMTISIDHGSENVWSANLTVLSIENYDSGDPIGGTASNNSISDGAVSITLNETPATSSLVLGFLDVQLSSSGANDATAGTGFTEFLDYGETTNYVYQQSEQRTGSASTSVSWLDSSASGGTFYSGSAIGIEIHAAAGPGTYDSIDTIPTGLTDTFSAVSDSSGNVYLTFIDDETTDQVSSRTYNGTSWSSAALVADAASDSDSYPTLSLDTTNSNLYAFWIDTSSSYVYYSSCAISSGCDLASEWAAETAWQTSGTNTKLSSNYSGAGLIFAQWLDGTTVMWDEITVTPPASDPSYSFQRRTWYDGTRYWRSIYDSTDERLEFEYSTDGASWTENTSARISSSSSDFSIEADSTNAFVVYTNGFDVEIRKASSYPATNFSWSTATVVYDGTGTTDAYYYPTIDRDTTSKLWVGSTRVNSGTYTYNAVQSTTANDQTAWATASSLDSSSNANKYGLLVGRTQGDMMAIWIDGTTIETKGYYSLTGWELNPVTIGTGTSGLTTSFSATSATNGDVHLTYINNSGQTIYQRFVAPLDSESIYPLTLPASSSDYHFEDQNGDPFFINADTAWSLTGQVSKEDAELYLRDTMSRGFNTVVVTLVDQYYVDNAPNNYYNDAPFTTVNDFTTPNEDYFAHADWVINKAADYGLNVLLAPMYLGWNGGGDGWWNELDTNNTEQDAAWYGDWVGDRYASFKNIMYQWVNDTNPCGYDSGTQSCTMKDKITAMAAATKAADANHIHSGHMTPEWSAVDHFSTTTPYNGFTIDFNMTYTYDPVHTKVWEDYNNSPVVPFFLFETHYEDDWDSAPPSRIRNQAYTSILAGAKGHAYGNDPIWHMNGNPADTKDAWTNHLDDEGRVDMKHFHDLFRSRDWATLVPDQTQTIVTAGYGTGYSYISAAKNADSKTAIIFFPQQSQATIDMSEIGGTGVDAWWYNPQTGAAQFDANYSNTGTQNFTPPTSQDWVLVLDNDSLGLSTPGSTTIDPGWQTAVTLDSNAGNTYPTISLNTYDNNLYVFWVRNDDIYYKEGVAEYLSADWDVSATSWKTTGTNQELTSNFSDAGRIFAQWLDGTTLMWDDLTVAGNTNPNSPSGLAQLTTSDVTINTGSWHNTTSIKFTATATDTDSSDTLYLCVETDDIDTAFSNSEDLCGTGIAYSGSGVTVSVTISAQTDATQYHWQARVKDAAGAYSSWVSYGGNSDTTPGAARDYGLDTTAPTGGTIYDGTNTGVDTNFSTISLSTLSANWDSFNSDVSGLNKYQYSIGTTQGGTEILGWTDNGTATSVTAGSLTLQTSTLYYFNVRAVDNAGNTGSAVSSNGQLVSPSLSFSISPASLTFASLNAGNSYTDTKITTLTTSTNAYNGYVIRAFTTDYLRSTNGNHTISDFTGGTYASPAAWGAATGYGYTSSDTSIQGFDKFGSGTLYAPFSQTGPGDIVADHTSTVSGTPITDEAFTITSRVTTSNTQASATYSTTVVYTATAQY